MTASNSKQRLFEVMGKVDKSFKKKLNENFNNSKSFSITLFGDEENVHFEFDRYDNNGALSVRLLDANNEPYSTVSVNLRESVTLPPDEFYLKNWSENEDLAKELIKIGAVIPTGKHSSIGAMSYKINPIYGSEGIDATQMNEKMIGKKPTRKSDDVSYYKGEGIFPGYTHFAVIKADASTPDGGMLKTANKIVNAWDYRGEDSEDLRADKHTYFTQDIKDMDISPKLVQIVATAYLKKRGIDPYDQNNWMKTEEMIAWMKTQY